MSCNRPSARRPAVTSSLIGTVRAKDGNPLEGVVISARAVGKSYTTSVFSDAKGGTSFLRSRAGDMTYGAQAVGFDTTRGEATIEPSRQARQTFTLSPIADITPHVSGSEWMAALPADTREQRRAKEIFRTNCTACHSPTYALQNRFDENGWRAVIMFMETEHRHGRASTDTRPSCTTGTISPDTWPRCAVRPHRR